MIGRLLRRAPPPPEARVAEAHRVYTVGDIHGRADLLEPLLTRIAADAEVRRDGRETRHVFLGDYIDRGDDSRQVLDRLLALRAEAGEAAVCLKGNHEAALLEFVDDPVGGARWLGFGGDRTLLSYGVPVPRDLSDAGALQAAGAALHAALGDHLAFLRSLPCLWRSGDYVFVHAALAPRVALEAQQESDMLWGNRRFLRQGCGLPGLRVVHGHYDDPEPVVRPERICIDTGAYYSERLTALCLDAGMRFL